MWDRVVLLQILPYIAGNFRGVKNLFNSKKVIFVSKNFV